MIAAELRSDGRDTSPRRVTGGRIRPDMHTHIYVCIIIIIIMMYT